MAFQYSTRVRSAISSAVTSTIEAASAAARPSIKFFTGTQPANCGLASTGTLLASGSITTPGYMATSASGVQSLASTVTGVAVAGGTIGYYRIFAGDGACDEQGSVTLTGSGGDMQIAGGSLALTSGQPFTLTSRSITALNA